MHNAFERFEAELGRALAQLYDADYAPAATITEVMSLEASHGVGPLQTAIIESIEELRPEPGAPAGTVQERTYDILHHRFVLKLTQEETAEQLCMSVRHLRRAQRRAVHHLARRLWDRASRTAPPGGGEPATGPTQLEGADGPQAWLSQLREELSALRQSAPDVEANVAEALERTMQLARVVTAEQRIALELTEPSQLPYAQIHPSELKQVLLAAIRVLTQGTVGGRVKIDAACTSEQVTVTVRAAPAVHIDEPALSLIREILAAHSGSVWLRQGGEASSLTMSIPVAKSNQRRLRVLVVDDNKDLVRSFQLFAAGTRYDIEAPDDLRELPSSVEALAPDAIVLDVMLPHTDGWEILLQLKAGASLRSVPIIVCSVVPEEDLALALGATLYLRKPVLRRQFIEALDAAFSSQPSAG